MLTIDDHSRAEFIQLYGDERKHPAAGWLTAVVARRIMLRQEMKTKRR